MKHYFGFDDDGILSYVKAVDMDDAEKKLKHPRGRGIQILELSTWDIKKIVKMSGVKCNER